MSVVVALVLVGLSLVLWLERAGDGLRNFGFRATRPAEQAKTEIP